MKVCCSNQTINPQTHERETTNRETVIEEETGGPIPEFVNIKVK